MRFHTPPAVRVLFAKPAKQTNGGPENAARGVNAMRAVPQTQTSTVPVAVALGRPLSVQLHSSHSSLRLSLAISDFTSPRAVVLIERGASATRAVRAAITV